MNEIKLSDVRTLSAKGPAGIYVIENILNGKRYIGQSVNINKRLKEHLYLALKNDRCRCNFYLYKDIRKTGADNFLCRIVKTFDTKNDEKLSKELEKAEIDYINKYKTYVKDNPKTGYNLTIDGKTRKYLFSNAQKKLMRIDNDNGKTIYKISKELNISEPIISNAINSTRTSNKNKKIKARDKEIQKKYMSGLSIKEIEKETGYSHGIVQKSLVRTNTRPRKKRAANTHQYKKIVESSLRKIEEDYINDYSLRQLATKYKISRNTISLNLKELGYSITNKGNKMSKRAVLEIDVVTGETIAEYESLAQACKSKKLKSTSSVSDVASKKYDRNKTAAGSKWEYVDSENPYIFSNYSQIILK